MTTDIWEWVYETHGRLIEGGQHRLATALVEIAGHAVDGRNDQLDAMYPEALASARALGLPWVEVFLRHWRLQNLLNKRHQGEKAMSEAVSLLEFAHREETAGCPQSVCAVQDFTICHANIDGPGYVPERLAVLEEALERVEPARACFDCLSREYADTLEDDGRADAALAHLDRAQGRIRAAGETVSLSFGHARASALYRLGRFEDALEALAAAELAHTRAGHSLDDDDRRKRAVIRARVLARLGRFDEALAELPEPAEADEFADIRHRWTEAVELLVDADRFPNDALLGARLAHWVSYLDAAGSHRPCLDLALAAGRLAVRRGAREVALALAVTGERKLALLRRTDRVAEQVAGLRAAALALPVAELPVPAGELLELLGARDQDAPADPEADLELLTAAWAAADSLTPAAATDLLLSRAGLLASLGHEHASAELLWARLDQDPDHQELVGMLGSVLIEARDGDGLRRLADRVAAAGSAQGHWLRARWAMAEGRWAEVLEQCEALLRAHPERINPRRMAATAATELGDHATAQRFGQELLEHAPPAGDLPAEERYRAVQPADLWHLITAATANRDWAAVRSAGARLGIEFDQPDGPVDEEWQYVTVRARRDNGAKSDLPALRTGPATARILPVLGEDIALNHGDVVVFRPEPLEPAPDEDAPEEQKRRWRPTFELLTLLDPAGYTTWFVDGAWPGDPGWEELRRGLRERGFGLWAYSGDQYLITDPVDGGATLPGIYAAVGVPPTASTAEADALLEELTADWPHRLSWLELAKAAGADTTRHQEVIQQYGL
jgi:tetratricopeptide (TPR) repeat protein